MRKEPGIAIGVAVTLAVVAALLCHDGLRQFVRGYIAPARTAYVILEQRPLSASAFEQAAGLIQRARQRDPQAPWVYIALAKAMLVYGYRLGSRYEASSFLPEAVDRAREFSERALKLGPEHSLAWALRGRIAIIDAQPCRAQAWLDRAQQLDRGSFYPHYYKSILYRQTGDLSQARRYLAQAQARHQRSDQGRWVLQARRDLAALGGHRRRAEALSRRIIDRYPASAQARADYGDFLIHEQRFAEAVVQLEKSLEIAPFPPVRRRLENARVLAQQRLSQKSASGL